LKHAVAANKLEIRKQGGLAALVKSLDFPDPDTKRNAALALSSLLEDCKKHYHLFI
jgi:RNase P/RNase MRP subunit p30